MNSNEDLIGGAQDALATARHILVLTGAGISAESGVPTFRGGGGSPVWRGMPFEVLSSAQMIEQDLPLVWEWFDYRRGVMNGCRPNAAHIAIARAQSSGRFDSFTLVTQNIDGLHREAGSAEPVELHGNIHQARCLSCGLLQEIKLISDGERPPVCPDCFDSMRPNVVLFGETLERAYEMASACDVCLVVGTSALVHPANQIPMIAKREGASVIEINPEATGLSPAVDLSIRGKAAEVLPGLLK